MDIRGACFQSISIVMTLSCSLAIHPMERKIERVDGFEENKKEVSLSDCMVSSSQEESLSSALSELAIIEKKVLLPKKQKIKVPPFHMIGYMQLGQEISGDLYTRYAKSKWDTSSNECYRIKIDESKHACLYNYRNHQTEEMLQKFDVENVCFGVFTDSTSDDAANEVLIGFKDKEELKIGVWHRADPSAPQVHASSLEEQHALWQAVEADSCADVERYLQQNGNLIHARNAQYHTPMYRAVQKGNLTMAKLLLRHKAALKEPNYPAFCAANIVMWYHSDSALHAASKSNNLDLAQLLIDNKANVNDAPYDHNTPLHVAGGREVIQLLLKYSAQKEARNRSLQTPLAKAVDDEAVEVVKAFIEQKCDVNQQYVRQQTLLHTVRNAEIAQLLLGSKADLEAKSERQETPLHIAVAKGRPEIARLLISNNGNVNAKDSYGRTPLYGATDQDNVKLLLEAKAKVCVRDSCWYNNSDKACMEGKECKKHAHTLYEWLEHCSRMPMVTKEAILQLIGAARKQEQEELQSEALNQ